MQIFMKLRASSCNQFNAIPGVYAPAYVPAVVVTELNTEFIPKIIVNFKYACSC